MGRKRFRRRKTCARRMPRLSTGEDQERSSPVHSSQTAEAVCSAAFFLQPARGFNFFDATLYSVNFKTENDNCKNGQRHAGIKTDSCGFRRSPAQKEDQPNNR